MINNQRSFQSIPDISDPYGFQSVINSVAEKMTAAQNAQPPAAAILGDTRLGKMIGGEPRYQESDYRRGPDPSGRPVVEMAPTPQVQPGPQAQDELLSILDNNMNARAQEMAAQFQEQEGIVRGRFQNLLDHLEGEYKIERKYIEQTPMEPQQREEKIRQLNLRYEKQIYKLQQEAEGPMSELQSERSAAMAKLQAQWSEAMRRVQTVRDLVKSGKIVDENGALQEQLQAVGISLPISALKPPSPPKEVTLQDQLKSIRSELEFVNSAVSRIVPNGKPGKNTLFNKDGTLRNDAKIKESKDAKPRPMTKEERETANALFAQQRALETARNKLLGELQLGRLTRAMSSAGSMQGNQFADKLAATVSSQTPAKKKPTLAIVNQLKSQGLSRAQAEQWLRENGYDVGS